MKNNTSLYRQKPFCLIPLACKKQKSEISWYRSCDVGASGKCNSSIFHAAIIFTDAISGYFTFRLSLFLERKYIKFGGFCFEFQCLFLDSIRIQITICFSCLRCYLIVETYIAVYFDCHVP